MKKDMLKFRSELKKELIFNILPYWLNCKDDIYGGFIGRINGNELRKPFANKGAVMMSRIVWTFSAAYRVFNDSAYLAAATEAKDFLLRHFIDSSFGGVYWEVDYSGKPIDTKKQVYAIAFAIYGLSEYHRATADKNSLQTALDLFLLIEKHSYDATHNGYIEALTRDWKSIGDMRLSEKDENEKFTMNTHLHILEAYTNLLRVYPDETLRGKVKNLVMIFIEKVINVRTNHLGLFFDERWNEKSGAVSYGHDIEASWLLYESAEVLGDHALIERLKKVTSEMAHATLQGIEREGGMIYESDRNGHRDTEKHWWVQAEAVVGYFFQYSLEGDINAWQTSVGLWNYIKNHIIDSENGEWVWSVYPDGSVNRAQDKVGLWKCPYHNGRMCLTIIEIIDKIYYPKLNLCASTTKPHL